MLTRRKFLSLSSSVGLASASMPLWSNLLSTRALAQSTGSSYKAIVLITLTGGNDSNNMLVPLDSTNYNEYAALRTAISLPQASLLPLTASSGAPTYGLHPSLTNIAKLYNNGQALVVANAGPLSTPVTKAQLLANPRMLPAAFLSHPAGQAQWESAQNVALPDSGWGGRMADYLASQSGSLPPVLNAGLASIFTVGRKVQGIVLQAKSGQIIALPAGINSAIAQIAADDSQSTNQIVAQAAQLRAQALQEQTLIAQAQAYGTLKTAFPTTGIGTVLQTIAQTINGRSVLGASRQIFYCDQGNYDTHVTQLGRHAELLADLDGAVGAFTAALVEMGLSNQVLICTASDFSRTMQANVNSGSDHAWGSHQLVIGGGIRGGRILGTMPDLELGGSSDWNFQGDFGTWIPTTSVTQVAAGVGSWMGLSASQLSSIFPDLANFGNLPLQLT
jgi:uncharacterized protein (DUF1501 family)